MRGATTYRGEPGAELLPHLRLRLRLRLLAASTDDVVVYGGVLLFFFVCFFFFFSFGDEGLGSFSRLALPACPLVPAPPKLNARRTGGRQQAGQQQHRDVTASSAPVRRPCSHRVTYSHHVTAAELGPGSTRAFSA